MIVRIVSVVMAMVFACCPVVSVAAAETTTTVNGTVLDTAKNPVSDATISASGPTGADASATDKSGTFSLDLAPGKYTISIQKAGYTNLTVQTVIAADTKGLLFSLSGSGIAERVVSNASINTSAQSVSSLERSSLDRRPATSLVNVVTQLPGLTVQHDTGADPDTNFAIRGAAVETRVQIDGHAVSGGANGRFNTSLIPRGIFDSIDLVKGAGLSGANAGESAFGIINFGTRGFTSNSTTDARVGFDDRFGQYSVFSATGNVLKNKLSYVFVRSSSGNRGASDKQVETNVLPGADNTGIISYIGDFSSRESLNGEVAKLRYRFSPQTSLSLGFVGIQGAYLPQGSAYGSYLGERTIVPSLATTQGPQFNAPYAQNLVGKTIATYQWFPNSVVTTNQPLFDAEFRTVRNNDTFILRPYTGTIYKYVDGNGRSLLPNGATNNSWSEVVDPSKCTTSAPCYVGTNPQPLVGAQSACAPTAPCYTPNYDSPYVQEELDRLHGLTFTYLHAVHGNVLSAYFDYHSDQTAATQGDPSVPEGLQTVVAPTTSKIRDLALTYAFGLGSRLRAGLGLYSNSWDLAYQAPLPGASAPPAGTTPTLAAQSRRTSHIDPHVTLSYRADDATALRFSGGSSITLPYAVLISGAPNITLPSNANNFVGTITFPNPDLKPETTVAYDLGVDHRIGHSTVVAVDGFYNIIYDVFIPDQRALNGPIDPNTGLAKYKLRKQTTNGPVEYNYGLEATITHQPPTGLGYRFTGTTQRAYYAQIPPSLFAISPVSLIDYKQLDGTTSVPFTTAYAELEYRLRRIDGSLGALYTGSNNASFGPAFIVLNGSLHASLRTGFALRLSGENLTNRSSGVPIGAAISGAGFQTVLLGTGKNGARSYRSSATSLGVIAPRSIRLTLEAAVDR